jgi:hypothetical protein
VTLAAPPSQIKQNGLKKKKKKDKNQKEVSKHNLKSTMSPHLFFRSHAP